MCGNSCFDLTSDPNNCGRCGNVCTSGTCSNSQCGISCSNPGQCGAASSCSQTGSDGGSCYCYARPGGTAVCSEVADCGSSCSQDNDCDSSQICVLNTCCGAGNCHAKSLMSQCGNPASARKMFKWKPRGAGQGLVMKEDGSYGPPIDV